MGDMILKLLKKFKTKVFDRYILLLSVPLGLILEFLITAPFLIFCSLDNLFKKRNDRS
jgi:hypothetical protein